MVLRVACCPTLTMHVNKGSAHATHMDRQRNVVESEFDAAQRALERENERLREDLLDAKRDIKCVLSGHSSLHPQEDGREVSCTDPPYDAFAQRSAERQSVGHTGSRRIWRPSRALPSLPRPVQPERPAGEGVRLPPGRAHGERVPLLRSGAARGRSACVLSLEAACGMRFRVSAEKGAFRRRLVCYNGAFAIQAWHTVHEHMQRNRASAGRRTRGG